MNLPTLINQMLTADFYPHPVVEPITLIQTHISFVLLTGQYAYKVKKPMNFGFLDFSTLEKRHFFCHEELRLNRRLAPNLYLQVLAIAQDQDRYYFAPESASAAEYAIQMVQFPQEQLLINVFDQGKLTTSHMQQIAQQLAQFHKAAATNDHIATFGTAASLKQVADDNYAGTNKYVGTAQTAAQLEQTRAYSDRRFREAAQLFSDRLAGGKIRECHGDLHLKNICLINDTIQIFDCIEFNEPFRNTDVLYDAAFLVMDLQYRGRPDLANIFLNTYLELTNDYRGAVLLPLFCSMRAYIRAKVTSFLLDDPNLEDDAKAAARQEATAYYNLAHAYTQSSEGKIYMMAGLSGSGKTTTARSLAIATNAIHLRSDAIRKHLAGLDDLMTRGTDELYSPAMTQRTYGELLNLAIALTTAGQTVILDAKYDHQQLRQEVITAAQNHRIPLEIIYCEADPETLNQRLSDRQAANSDIADATPEILAQQSFEPFTAQEQIYLR